MNLVGCTFNNLLVVKKYPATGHNSKWECRCLLCDSLTVVTRPNLRSGNTKDCGCQRARKIAKATKTHGDSRNQGTVGYEIYKKWTQMHARCRDRHKPYLRKGIKVCLAWEEYEPFKKWALAGNFDPKLELDRIDNSAGYSPDNCRWVTHAENCRNKDHPLSRPVKNNQGQVFSSCQTASLAIGKERGAVAKAIKSGYRCAGKYWSYL
jgi:hypothetical protein